MIKLIKSYKNYLRLGLFVLISFQYLTLLRKIYFYYFI